MPQVRILPGARQSTRANAADDATVCSDDLRVGAAQGTSRASTRRSTRLVDTLVLVSVANEIEVVVGSDGSLTVPADKLARHGVGPGAHLRLVAASDGGRGHRSRKGALESIATPDAVQAWSEALDDDRVERRSRFGFADE